MNPSSQPVTSKSEIRQATLSDKEAIWDFIKLAYPNSHCHMIPDRWNWQYTQNPNISKVTEELPIWIALKGASIVGQLCTIPVEIKTEGGVYPAVWGVDLIVLPSCRGEGVGHRLIQEAAETCQFYMAIEMSDTTKRIYNRLNYPDLTPVPVYRRIVNLTTGLILEYLDKCTRSERRLKRVMDSVRSFLPIDRMLASLLNALLRVRYFFIRLRHVKISVTIKEVQEFGNEIDALWVKVSDSYDVIAKRDQRFLNWRYATNKQLHYHLFIALRNENVVGYSVLRRPLPIERNFGYIVDWFADINDSDTLSSLIQHAIEFFGDDVEVIECACTYPEYKKTLKKSGFIKMRESVPYFHCTNAQGRDRSKIKAADWFITKGDSDWDQIYPWRAKP
jgi:ribosomal protein S18 acetylase RimI-like enzyme